jgi:hypothetical protein
MAVCCRFADQTLLVDLFMAACSTSSTRTVSVVRLPRQQPHMRWPTVAFMVGRRQRHHPRRSRSIFCSKAAPVGERSNQGERLDVRTHRPQPAKGVATAALWRPACCPWDGAAGHHPLTVSPARHRDRSLGPARLRQKHRCRPPAEEVPVRKTRGASWTVSKLNWKFC